jgi:alpha-2-macroglobulin
MMSDLRYIIDTQASARRRRRWRAPRSLQRWRCSATGRRAERGFKDAIGCAHGLARQPDGFASRLWLAPARCGSDPGAGGREQCQRADLIQTAALVSEARTASRYTSTQENAWLVLAAQAGPARR